MAEITLPFEVKRLVFDYLDLPTLKSLRLVSRSWAAVGVELLLLPNFVVKSSQIDITRLINISSCPNVARQAARTIRTVSFHSNDWDPVYLRSIVCSRHVHLRNYEVVDFVPTRDEQAALSELDAIITQRSLDLHHSETPSLLARAFQAVPRVQTVHITCPNPFIHPLLRKVWEEYNLETYRHPQISQGPQRLLNILSSFKAAGLEITEFRHEQFNSNFFFAAENLFVPWDFSLYLSSLRSLSLVVNDVLISLAALAFASNGSTSTALHHMISAAPKLEELSIKFESIDRIPFDFLPSTTTTGNLHSLSLSGVSISAPKFLSFISSHCSTLRRLCIASVELLGDEGDWKLFLENLRDAVGAGCGGSVSGEGTGLEKFQLSGLVKWAEPNGETWLLWPIYRDDWTEVGSKKSARARDIERFVVEGAEWPMGEGDDISHLFS